jgi:hypothetical protein
VAMASRRFLPGIDSRVCFACFVPAYTSVFAPRLAIPATIRLVGRRLSERQHMILVVHVRQLSRDDHEKETRLAIVSLIPALNHVSSRCRSQKAHGPNPKWSGPVAHVEYWQ